MPGGRVVATFFLLNEESTRMIEAGGAQLGRELRHDMGGYRVHDPEVPEAIVGYPEQTIRELYDRHRLEIVEPIRFGMWCGRSGSPTTDHNLDYVLARRSAETPRAG
jgi:hypothetical protein